MTGNNILYLLKNILEFACGYAHYNQAIGQNNGLQVLYEKRNKLNMTQC